MAQTETPLLGCRLLIVEDNFLIAQAVADIVEKAGAEVTGPYPNMIDALENLSDLAAIDGAILDIGLGETMSYPLAEALQTTRIPFMFLTGVSKDNLPEQFARTPHMLKPFDAQRLVAMLVDMGVRPH